MTYLSNLQSSQGTSQNQAASSSTSQSTSTPQNMTSPQVDLATQIAQLAGQYGQSVFDWAGNTYNSMTGVTNDMIQNYMDMASRGAGLAATAQNDYNTYFRPEYASLDALAKQYASPERQAQEMGRAESGVEQGAQAGIDNARKNLQSYGIDPSSGRYGELEYAQNAATGAAAAGAAQEARRATEGTGIQLLENSMQFGQQLPGDIVNALNVQGQGIAGAQNANLANTSVGTAAMGAANPYFSTGVNLKYPPVGQSSQSTSDANSASSGSSQQSSSGVGYSALPIAGGGGGIKQGSGPGGTGGGFANTSGLDAQIGAMGSGAGGTATNTGYSGSPQFNYADPYSGGSYDPYAGITGDTLGGYDPYAGAGTSYSQPYTSSYYDPYSAYGSTSGFVDTSSGAMPGGGTDLTYGGYFYDKGGAIPEEGGQVPVQASPSQGQQTDDVPARLNAGEFVIPKDVAAWKGHEFFQKLIDQSRSARTMGTAKPTMKAPLPNQQKPSFVSRGIH